tara:strand:+ start:127 stop:603 length:477 start_codon:yes stop_codon:yes gene_type:complete
MASQTELDYTFLEIAFNFSKLSKAIRRKVGCVIVKDGQIISNGFNGTPSGFDNSCEYLKEELDLKEGKPLREYNPCNLTTKPEVLHAESNALMKLARSTNSSVGSTMYLTCSPCFECAKLIIQSGITRLVYCDDYTSKKGLDLLEKTDIIIVKTLMPR